MADLLAKHKDFIDMAYKLRSVVNHSYNEDLADSYRKDNYKESLHVESFAFIYEPDHDRSKSKFTLGRTTVDMDEILETLKQIEAGLLALDVPNSGSYKVE